MDPTLARLYDRMDPLARCVYLDLIWSHERTSYCDHTYRHTRTFLAGYAPDRPLDPTLALLG